MIELTAAGNIVAIISIGVTLFTFAVNKIMINQDKMEHIQKRTKEINKNMKEKAKDTDGKVVKKLEEEQKELMTLMGKQMKMSMKPMLVTIIPILLLFGYLRTEYDKVGTVALLLGMELTWFWWYFIVVIITSIILNKTYSTVRKVKKQEREGVKNAKTK